MSADPSPSGFALDLIGRLGRIAERWHSGLSYGHSSRCPSGLAAPRQVSAFRLLQLSCADDIFFASLNSHVLALCLDKCTGLKPRCLVDRQHCAFKVEGGGKYGLS